MNIMSTKQTDKIAKKYLKKEISLKQLLLITTKPKKRIIN